MSHAVTVRPIHDDADLAVALTRLDRIFHAERETPEGDEREVLSLLIHDYERRNHPVEASGDPEVDPVDALVFHMERLGLRNVDLIPALGASSRVSEVLGRKRALTVGMIRGLYREFGISPEDLLGVVRNEYSTST